MINTCKKYLSKLCSEIPERPVGSKGNQMATRRFMEIVQEFGWKVDSTSFQAMDWDENGAELWIDQKEFEVYPSPYSLGCELEAELIAVSTIQELEEIDCAGKIVLLHGNIVKEQLMPKNFVFYNPEEHQRIIAELELKNPGAIVCATSRNASLAGGVYPFPLIEDGDFNIPSVYMTEEEGKTLVAEFGRNVHLVSRALRIPATAYNLTARKGGASPHD